MKEKSSWLDTETKAILEPSPPLKKALPSLPEFALVLLEKGNDIARMLKSVRRVNDCDNSQAKALLQRALPLIVNRDLSYEDALLGQFEFICSDAITVFISSDVIAQGKPSYLRQLYARLKRSEEFAKIELTIHKVPNSEQGVKFLNQFLGLHPAEVLKQKFPLDMKVLHKKARIMSHWSKKIGVELQITDAGK